MTIKDILASFAVGTCLVSLITGCGESKQIPDKLSTRTTDEAKESIEGKYIAKLSTMNSSISGLTSGVAKIHLIADQIYVQVDIKNAPASMAHAQHIYTASECPANSHDTNNDGFIDPVEASKVLGGILIPLDGDLNSQEEGLAVLPVANRLGAYKYYQEGSLFKLLSDLTGPDLDLKDEMIKLRPDQVLSLNGKVIVIHGIAEDIYLPGSILRNGQTSEYATLAIACGKIERVLNGETDIVAADEN